MRLPRAGALIFFAAAMTSTAASPPPAVLHRDAIVVDLHSDVILDVAAGKRDIAVRGTTGHVDLPRLREGGVDVQVFALFVHPRYAGKGFQRVTELLDAFEGLARAQRSLAPATTVAAIRQAVRAGRIAAVLSVENGSAIDGDPANLDRLYTRGVRILSLTWNQSNDLADGALEETHGGLTPLGRRVLARMAERRMIVDVSHLSERAFWAVLEATTGPIVATHSNAAGLTPHRRNLTDDQLRALARRGGIVGVNYYPAFTGGPTIQHVLDHVNYLVEIMGADHVALGSDFDGFSQTVTGLEDVSKLPALTAGLLARGYAPDDARKILGANALRVFQTVWGK
jgi:membrane dipeptidase